MFARNGNNLAAAGVAVLVAAAPAQAAIVSVELGDLLRPSSASSVSCDLDGDGIDDISVFNSGDELNLYLIGAKTDLAVLLFSPLAVGDSVPGGGGNGLVILVGGTFGSDLVPSTSNFFTRTLFMASGFKARVPAPCVKAGWSSLRSPRVMVGPKRM
jgi:hypothetical protein